MIAAEARPARVLITGGSGFIGTNLVAAWRARGAEVLNLDIAPPRDPHHGPLWARLDIRERDALGRAIADFAPDLVFHMAARTDLEGRRLDDYAANVAGVANLLAALAATPVPKAVFASTMLVCRYGRIPAGDDDYCPDTRYGESKAIGERLIREAGLDGHWLIVRPTSIWGPWFDAPYRGFFQAVAKGRYVHPGGADVTKALGYVGNLVHILDRLVAAPAERTRARTFYIADYPPVRLSQWAEAVRRACEARPIRTAPLWALEAAAAAGDAAKALGWRAPPLTRFRLRNMTTASEFDMTEVAALAGPLPFDLDAGARETVAWMRTAGLLPARER